MDPKQRQQIITILVQDFKDSTEGVTRRDCVELHARLSLLDDASLLLLSQQIDEGQDRAWG